MKFLMQGCPEDISMSTLWQDLIKTARKYLLPKHQFQPVLVKVFYTFIGLFLLGNIAFSQGPCPSSNCVSGDIRITKVELLQIDGSPLPNSCDPGQSNIQVKLRVTFDVTSSTRYGFLVTASVYIDNNTSGAIANCDGSTFTQGVHTMDVTQYTSGSPILWPCGSTIQLRSVYTAWDQQAPTVSNPGICTYLNSDGSISNCAAIDPKCKFYGDDEAITVVSPLIANFTWLGSCPQGQAVQTIAFTNTTSGGKTPYSSLWNFGDGTTSTSTNPSHNYATAGNYTVTLTITDATTGTAQTDGQSYLVAAEQCCVSPGITDQPTVQTKCAGEIATFSVTPSGGTPSPTIQWQEKIGAGSFANLSDGGIYSGVNTTTLTLTGVAAGMNGNQYRAVLTSGTCNPVNSNAATLNVDAPSNGGTLGTAKTICSGSTSGLLTVSGFTGAIQRWESSPNGSAPWTTISNTNNTFTSGALTSNIWYRVIVKNGQCPEANSNAIKITVDAPSNGGTLGTAKTICSGSNSGLLSVSGFTGAIQRWESSPNGSAPWTTINNTNDNYTSGALTSDIWYRVIVKNGQCSETNSNAIKITVDAPSNGGTLGIAKNICSGSNSGLLTVSGFTGAIQRWESSPNGSAPWATINNTNNTFTSGALTSDIWYRVIVKNGQCSETNSNAIKITVDAPSNGGTLGTAKTICSGSNSGLLTVSGFTGTIQRWESSPNGSAPWTTINNTNSTFTSGALTSDIWYRVIVKNGECSETNSNAIKITVDAPSNGGTLGTAKTICSGQNSGLLTVSGFTGTILRWESSPNGNAPWTTINNTNSNYTSGALTSDIWYRVIVKNGQCPETNSNAIKITVNPASAGGSVASAQTICSGDQLVSDLVLSGQTGSVVKWQRSANSSFSPFTDINNNSATLASADIGPLTQDTWFRAVVQNGDCATANSAAVKITVNQPASITTQPVNAVQCAGQGVTFSLSASGAGPLTYQWYKVGDPDPIPVGTNLNSLHIFPVSAADEGSYYVVVTGICGSSAVSNTVTLTLGDCKHLFPTETNCTNYSSGTVPELDKVCYTTSKGKVSNAIPGVFFYFTTITIPDGYSNASFTVVIDQTSCGTFGKNFAVQKDQVIAWKDCLKYATGSEILINRKGTGDATITLPKVNTGETYVISVKYDTKSLVGAIAGSDCQYVFEAKIGSVLGVVLPNSTGYLRVTPNCSTTPAIVARTQPEMAITPASTLGVIAYPNPYNDEVNFNFVSPESGRTVLEIYDLVGRKIAVVFEGYTEAGIQKTITYKIPASQRVAMIYRLIVGNKSSSGKLFPGNKK
jgi:hypothetical protein